MAREMAQKALKERLEKMEMTIEEAKIYESYYKRVEKQINQLTSLLESMQTNSKSDRLWIKRSEHGEFDENRVVEAILHQKDIYKKRGTPVSSFTPNSQKPKRIRFGTFYFFFFDFTFYFYFLLILLFIFLFFYFFIFYFYFFIFNSVRCFWIHVQIQHLWFLIYFLNLFFFKFFFFRPKT